MESWREVAAATGVVHLRRFVEALLKKPWVVRTLLYLSRLLSLFIVAVESAVSGARKESDTTCIKVILSINIDFSMSLINLIALVGHPG